METHLVVPFLFLLLCSSHNAQGIEDSFPNSRKLLENISISPSQSPLPIHKNKTHHHHHHKNKKIPISPSPSPVPNPNSSPQKGTVPVISSGFIEPSSPESVSSPINHSKSRVVYVSIIGGVSLSLFILMILFIYIRAKKVVTVKPWVTGLSGQLQKAFVKGVPVLKRSEIENACEYFSNIIEYFGSNCIMYKGTLSSGVEIAVVSAIVNSSKGWSKLRESQFRKKITSLSKVNHKNFINLLGFCEESQPFTRMMVFEYAPNGTLFEHLHNNEMESLNWSTRLRIAIGVAYCLDHMHQLDPPVLLTNLNSQTIYLTDDLAAKVSDLSLSSGSKDDNTLDKETTVYHYGLLLLEIISGKLNGLENWALNNGPLNLKEIVDVRVESFDEKVVGELCEVIKGCVDSDPKKRPLMGEVAKRMREITEMPPQGAVPKISPLWWAELEIMSPGAAE